MCKIPKFIIIVISDISEVNFLCIKTKGQVLSLKKYVVVKNKINVSFEYYFELVHNNLKLCIQNVNYGNIVKHNFVIKIRWTLKGAKE